FLTLFVLPILYILFEKISKPKKRRKTTKSLAVIILLLCSVSSFAQQKVTLQQALTIANENSLVVKNSTLQTQYQQKLKESYLDIPQTAVSGEFGRINSLSNDYKIGISQEISFPTVYNRKKDFLNQQWKEALVNEKITAANLEKEVTEVFYRLLILTQKQQLLQRVDSLFVDFLEKTSNRLTHGEANVMEKASADLQRSQIKIQLKELRTVRSEERRVGKECR